MACVLGISAERDGEKTDVHAEPSEEMREVDGPDGRRGAERLEVG